MSSMLSSRQFQVLNTLWESKQPLLVSEIVERSSIHTSTVQLALKKLVKLGYVSIADIIHSRNVLGRTYRPCITKDEYLEKISQEMHRSDSKKTSLVALVEEETNPEILLELEQIIQKKLNE